MALGLPGRQHNQGVLELAALARKPPRLNSNRPNQVRPQATLPQLIHGALAPTVYQPPTRFPNLTDEQRAELLRQWYETVMGQETAKPGVLTHPELAGLGVPQNLPNISPGFGKVARIIGNLYADVDAATIGAPAGLKELITHPVGTGKQIGESYRHTYGPLFSGDLGEFAARVGEHPLAPALDVATIASLGTLGASKAGLLGIPAERSLALEGGRVQPFASPNPLTRSLQHALDRFSEQHPDLRGVGARARTARMLPHQSELELGRKQGLVEPLAVARKALTPEEDVAYHMLAKYGAEDPGNAVRLLDADIERRAARLADGATPSYERTAQGRLIPKLQAAREAMLSPSPALQNALQVGGGLSKKSEQTKIQLGALTPETAAEHLHLAPRIATGTQLGQQELQPLEQMLTMRPRTESEARQHLTDLEAVYTGLVHKAAKILQGEAPLDAKETLRRNEIRARFDRQNAGVTRSGRASGAGGYAREPFRPQTLKDEMLAQADDMLASVAAKYPTEPSVQRFVELRDQIGQLRDAVNQAAESSLAGEPRPTGIFGEKQVPTVEPGQPTEFAGPGAFHIPDVSRQPIFSLGRRKRSVTGKEQPLVQRSQGILYSQGRIRTGTKLTIEDYLRSARGAQSIEDKQTALRYSRPLNPNVPAGITRGPFLDPGYHYINPEGVKMPSWFKDKTDDQIAQMTPKEMEQHLAVNARLAHDQMFPQHYDALPPEVQKKVRQVHGDIVKAFEGGLPQGTPWLPTRVLKTVNNAAKDVLIYLKGSYAPVNFAGNVGFLAIQQGPWLLPNLLKSSERIGILAPETLRRLDREVGTGGAVALAGDKAGLLAGATRKLANVQGRLADTNARRAAIIHEFAKVGAKTDAEITALLDDPAQRAVLNQASRAAEEAMVRFRGLTASERRFITNAVFIYPWVKGATRWLGRTALDRPVQSDIMANLGQQGHQNTLKLLGRLASYLEGLVPIGGPHEALGTTAQTVMNPTAVSPLSTGMQTLETVNKAVTGHGQKSLSVANIFTPPIRAGIAAAAGYDPFYGRELPKGSSFVGNFLHQLVGDPFTGQVHVPALDPLKTLLADTPKPVTGPPSKQPTFLPEHGPMAALKQMFLGSSRPRELNLPAGHAKGEKEYRTGLPTPARETYDTGNFTKTVTDLAKRYKAIPPSGSPYLSKALSFWSQRRVQYATSGADKLTGRDAQVAKLRIDLDLAVKAGTLTKQEADATFKGAKDQKQDWISSFRTSIHRQYLGEEALSRMIQYLNDNHQTDLHIEAPSHIAVR